MGKRRFAHTHTQKKRITPGTYSRDQVSNARQLIPRITSD